MLLGPVHEFNAVPVLAGDGTEKADAPATRRAKSWMQLNFMLLYNFCQYRMQTRKSHFVRRRSEHDEQLLILDVVSFIYNCTMKAEAVVLLTTAAATTDANREATKNKRTYFSLISSICVCNWYFCNWRRRKD